MPRSPQQILDLIKNAKDGRLPISGGDIGLDGIKALADALKVNNNITELIFVLTCINDEKIGIVADALKVNSTITSITLNYNDFGDKGAEALAEMLKVNNNICSLALRKNQVGDKGAEALAKALNLNISRLLLDDNISNSIQEQVTQVTRRNADTILILTNKIISNSNIKEVLQDKSGNTILKVNELSMAELKELSSREKGVERMLLALLPFNPTGVITASKLIEVTKDQSGFSSKWMQKTGIAKESENPVLGNENLRKEIGKYLKPTDIVNESTKKIDNKSNQKDEGRGR